METTQRDSRGWRLDIGEFYIGADQQGRGQTVTAVIDGNGISVEIDCGSGYDRYTANATIPIEHLRAILTAFDAQQALMMLSMQP